MAKRNPVPGRSRFTDPIVGRAWLPTARLLVRKTTGEQACMYPAQNNWQPGRRRMPNAARARRRNEPVRIFQQKKD